jgi:hypothetical protein
LAAQSSSCGMLVMAYNRTIRAAKGLQGIRNGYTDSLSE